MDITTCDLLKGKPWVLFLHPHTHATSQASLVCSEILLAWPMEGAWVLVLLTPTSPEGPSLASAHSLPARHTHRPHCSASPPGRSSPTPLTSPRSSVRPVLPSPLLPRLGTLLLEHVDCNPSVCSHSGAQRTTSAMTSAQIFLLPRLKQTTSLMFTRSTIT